jgi:squalene-associated FAD-dependent desaturase
MSVLPFAPDNAHQSSTESPTVAVIGGGLAGLASACALAESGFRVSVIERRPYLGGRASSYELPGTGEVVDNCQHLLLGCCTNLRQFYARLGVADKIGWYPEFTFVAPGGRASVIKPSPWPAPFHTVPAFLRVQCLTLLDKLSIAGALAAIIPGLPGETGETFLSWLRRHRQTGRAIERFWKPILISALNEDLDRVSVPHAAQVVRKSFLNSAAAGRIGLPMVPLTELYDGAGAYLRARGGKVQLRTAIETFCPADSSVTLLTQGREASFDYLVLAVPGDALARMLPPTSQTETLRSSLARFETSPITGIHLWFDRPISDLMHAVLLDRTIQWMFHKSRLLGRNDEGSYVELVVSSSKSLVEKSKSEIVELARGELGEFFPEVRVAKLVKSTVIKEVHATFSPRPGIDSFRPKAETLWPRVFLAGDWTATGWPATMEGAVRSGYLAAEALARAAGKGGSFLVPDLSPAGFMRWFG